MDLVVVGDPLGVYFRAWKWGAVHHVAFQENHKPTLGTVSGGVEQVAFGKQSPFSPRLSSGSSAVPRSG